MLSESLRFLFHFLIFFSLLIIPSKTLHGLIERERLQVSLPTKVSEDELLKPFPIEKDIRVGIGNSDKVGENKEAASQNDNSKRKKVCLNMIVKNESKVITRGLATVKPLIDYWVIVDTGSTDQTQQIIKDYLKDIPGEFYERPWKNFEHNRNEALALAKGKADYVMLMDADDTLQMDAGFKMPDLNFDCYNTIILHANIQYERPLLIKDALDWKWKGVLHEYLSCSQFYSSNRISGIKKIYTSDGVRSQDPLKFLKDAEVLEEALKEDPTNSRYRFYLAQSYRDAGKYALALENYKKREEMTGWDQETFWSKFQIAQMQVLLNMPAEVYTKSYYDAFHFRPTRAEPLYYLSLYYRTHDEFTKANQIASIGMSMPLSKDILFVEEWIYDYGMQFEKSISSYWIGKYEECKELSQQLLTKKTLPDNVREAIERNIGFANQQIIKKLSDIE